MGATTKMRYGAHFAIGVFIAVVCTITAPAISYADPAETPTGLVQEEGHTVYYNSGEKLTDSWKTIKGKRYYFGSDGAAKTGSAKIGKNYYIFSKTGALLKGKGKRLIRVRSNLYYVNSKGRPAETGWVVIKNRLYKFKKSGRALKSTKDSGITFTSRGVAKVNTASKLKIAVRKKIALLTNSSWSRYRKLKRMFTWAVTRTFVNSTEPKDIGKPGWAQRCALRVFQTGQSECFGTACSFAMIAYELGYSPTIRGTRYVHAYVLIDGKRWDNMASQPHVFGATSWRVTSWSSTSPKATGKYATASKAAKKKAAKKKAKAGWTAKKRSYRLASGKLAKGDHVIGGKIYSFSSKGKRLKKRTARLRALAKANADPQPLLDALGRPRSVSAPANSCYVGPGGVTGKDVSYRYAHLTVNVLVGDDGKRYLESVA